LPERPSAWHGRRRNDKGGTILGGTPCVASYNTRGTAQAREAGRDSIEFLRKRGAAALGPLISVGTPQGKQSAVHEPRDYAGGQQRTFCAACSFHALVLRLHFTAQAASISTAVFGHRSRSRETRAFNMHFDERRGKRGVCENC
jgi:hypothetical protein